MKPSASLIGMAEARDYLDALALFDGTIEPESGDAQRVVDLAVALLESLSDCLVVDPPTIVEEIARRAPGSRFVRSRGCGARKADRVAPPRIARATSGD